jgi:hypothetical protein
MTSMLVIRWVMVALTAVLAALLIARGNVVIGVVLGALAVTRVALLVGMQRRRERFRRRIQRRDARSIR